MSKSKQTSLLVHGYEVVIGFETHAQLSTHSKIFSRASVAFGADPNTQACAVDMALPGTLPVMNKGAVERAIQFGLAVGSHVAERSIFARKNYFYPDLPKGYQISQFEIPVVQGGEVSFFLGNEKKTVRLVRAHLEEDAGKSLHEDFHGQSGIDLNRAGTPLLEIVTEPDIRSSAEAVAYAKELHKIVTWIGICDGNMQEGSFRCDANVSVRKPGAPLGTRREIKNLNSFKFMQQAIDFEVRWQIEQIEQQKQEAIKQALTDAGIELKEREVAIKERKADGEIGEINARAVQIGVQAAFSAMQAGAQIAQMPMIAPIADAVMQGAGYQRPNPLGDDPNFPVADQTAAMNIKSPYIQGQGAESVATPEGESPEVRTNTSPTYPPVPDDGTSPMQGIETPRTTDNLPGAPA